MFYKAVDKITKGIEPTPQSESIVPLRCYPRKPEDSRINWGSAAKDIHALIRASSHPFEGAFCFTEKNQCIRIFRAVLYKPKYEFCAIPGQVCFIDKGIAYISCGDKSTMVGITEYSVEQASQKDSEYIICSSLRNRLK